MTCKQLHRGGVRQNILTGREDDLIAMRTVATLTMKVLETMNRYCEIFHVGLGVELSTEQWHEKIIKLFFEKISNDRCGSK